MNRIIIVLILTLGLTTTGLQSQELTQTIKGRVLDSESGVSLPGATVIIPGTDPLIGTVTDINGYFRIGNVSVGRYDLQVSFVGYEPFSIRELIVGSAKEVILNIGLKESVEEMEVVEIRARQDKDKALNPMAIISARQLSIEEARRYAGGVDDLAQLATSFAGVAGNLSSNAIAVRGNAPKGLLWQMEGVQISNPSHYANVTSFGGGAFTALSAQLLANSDFYTGAWPAQFGNALSGVFDVKMRTGNNEKYEHAFQLGTIGVDISSEGPFKKGSRSSYLFNYRYSTFAFIAPVLPDDAAGNRFQDLSFKLNFPLKGNSGNLSLWGIGARDISDIKPNDEGDREYAQDFQKLFNRQYMCAVGLNYRKTLGKSAYLNSSLSGSGNGLKWEQDMLDNENVLQPDQRVINDHFKLSISTFVNKKFSAHHTNRTGFTVSNVFYNVDIRNADTSDSYRSGNPMRQISRIDGNSFLIQGFSQSKFALSSEVTFNIGLHVQHFTLNGATTLEPRAGINWQFAPSHSFSAGYGIHSMLEMLPIYFITCQEGDKVSYPNEDLKLSRAHHFVLAYKWNINEFMHFTIEPFYQHLYNIPVVEGTSFSLINLDQDWFVDDVFTNIGTGENYGIDFTLERFMHNNYYFMITGSLFQSKYKGGDDIERNARYNKNYVLNLLAGKEWQVGKNRKNLLNCNGRIVMMGGDRISPVDMDASYLAKDIVFDETRAFAEQKPENFHLHLGVNYRKNKKKHASVWSVQLINIVGSEEFYGYKYNLKTDKVENDTEWIVLPQISYKVEF